MAVYSAKPNSEALSRVALDAFLSDEHLAALPDDRFEGLKQLTDEFDSLFAKVEGTAQRRANSDKFLEAYGLLKAYLEAKEIDASNIDMPALGGDTDGNIIQIINAYRNVGYLAARLLTQQQAKNVVETAADKFKNKFTGAFAYSFSDDDFNRVQELINSLRTLIAESEVIDAAHQRRLLARLERLQRELHKKVSDLDRFWGLVGDAGVVVGKFGRDVKPIVDRIRELAGIIWRIQSAAEGLSLDHHNPFLLPDQTGDQNGDL